MSPFQEDLSIILNSFTFIGINLYGTNETNTRKRIINIVIFIISEIVLNAFGIYVLVASVFYMPFNNIIAKLMALLVNISILSFRFSFVLKRHHIICLTDRIERFIKSQTNCYNPVKSYVVLICNLSIAVPVSFNLFAAYKVVQEYGKHKQEYNNYLYSLPLRNERLRLYLILFMQTIYIFHFFIVPSLCMILLSFIYFAYGEVFKRTMSNIKEKLKVSPCAETMKKCLKVLQDILEVHQEIEDVLSFKTFLAYILSLLIFFHLVCILRYKPINQKPESIVYCILVFSWTLTWFGSLILAGSKVAEDGNLNHHFRRKIVLNSMNAMKKQRNNLLHLLLFLDCANTEITFTVWGMLKINREFLFTTLGIIISYSVLIATI